jgi:hypothetical protein
VGDVFGGISGGPDDSAGQDVATLEAVLDGAALWGMELDPRYRVLAATFEPVAANHAWGETSDRRLQVLCHPVSTILASLRRDHDGGRELLAFTEEQLVDVVAAFDGAPVSTPLFGQPEPRPGTWGPRFSVEGRSTAPDGTSRTLTVSLRHEELSLDVFARFDDIDLKGPDGTELAWP